MANRDIIVIGGSSGATNPLKAILGSLPAELPAAVFVILHIPARSTGILATVASAAGPLAVVQAEDRMPIAPGTVYIAAPDRHMLLGDGVIRLGRGPRENMSRPAIDPLFRSAALCCGPRTVGAVLTGTLRDGAAGLSALKQCGGITVVQDPGDAPYSEMPAMALARSHPDHIVGLAGMPALLESLVRLPAGGPVPVPGNLEYEVNVASNGQTGMSEMDRIGRRSVLACPDCHGVMWEIEDGDLVRYRCHEGHAYSAEIMSLALDDNLRRAFASALRALEERVALARKLEQQATATGRALSARSWADKAREFEDEARIIRNSIRRTDEIAAKFSAA